MCKNDSTPVDYAVDVLQFVKKRGVCVESRHKSWPPAVLLRWHTRRGCYPRLCQLLLIDTNRIGGRLLCKMVSRYIYPQKRYRFHCAIPALNALTTTTNTIYVLWKHSTSWKRSTIYICIVEYPTIIVLTWLWIIEMFNLWIIWINLSSSRNHSNECVSCLIIEHCITLQRELTRLKYCAKNNKAIVHWRSGNA